MGASFWFALRLVAIGLGALALLWQPAAGWIERAYVNGAYPGWQHAAYAVTDPLPWSLGDFAFGAGIVAIVWRIVSYARTRNRRRRARSAAFGMLLLDVAAIVGLYAVWFEVAWGWNYARAPIETRVAFDAALVTPAAAERLRTRAIAEMNALAGAGARARRRAARSRRVADRVATGGPCAPATTGCPTSGRPNRRSPIRSWKPPEPADSSIRSPSTPNSPATCCGSSVRSTSRTSGATSPPTLAKTKPTTWPSSPACGLRIRLPGTRGGSSYFSTSRKNAHYAHHEFSPLVWQDFAASASAGLAPHQRVAGALDVAHVQRLLKEQSHRVRRRKLQRSDALDPRRAVGRARVAAGAVTGIVYAFITRRPAATPNTCGDQRRVAFRATTTARCQQIWRPQVHGQPTR